MEEGREGVGMEWGFGETKMTAALLLSSLRSDGASP